MKISNKYSQYLERIEKLTQNNKKTNGLDSVLITHGWPRSFPMAHTQKMKSLKLFMVAHKLFG
jgi:pseudouridine-5'-phosphate glycosidase